MYLSVSVVICTGLVYAQQAADFKNDVFLKALNKDTSYVHLREKIIADFIHVNPGRWGEFVQGVDEDFRTKKKLIAFTFDACGGKHRNGYDAALIEYLQKEKIPATLFITGKWIDANFNTFMTLSRDTLFEIENHGFNHQPCSLDGESEYGVHGTASAAQAFDEVEANARKITALTHRRPRFYRSATAFIDEACARMTEKLGIQTISFQVLSGDAVPFTRKELIESSVLDNVRAGAIVIMHFNHPEWNTCEALQVIVPKLRAEGYHFVKLAHLQLYGKMQ